VRGGRRRGGWRMRPVSMLVLVLIKKRVSLITRCVKQNISVTESTAC
jgi:hypothetical protein